VIFRSEGEEDFGVSCIAFSKPLPKLVNGETVATPAKHAALPKNALLEFNFSIVLVLLFMLY
jgi:hypothetical protein